MKPAFAPVLLVVVGLLGAAPASQAQLAPWDPPKVTELARNLEVATRLLYDSFDKLPPLEKGAAHTRQYFRLKQEVRHMMREARWLARALEKGQTQEETLPGFESIATAMRWTRNDAKGVQTNADFEQKSGAASDALAALAPYFDPSAAAPAR
jgi:hypothetical protein